MSVRKSDDFIVDVERQYHWYLKNADEDVAERYLSRWKRPADFSVNIRNLDRAADSITRGFATDVSLSCFARSKSTSFSTK